MSPRKEQFKKVLEFLLPWGVLAVLLTYTYVKFFQHPYGFSWDSNGEIHKVFMDRAAPTIEVGDQLLQIGPLTWDEFHTDLKETFFEGVKPGETMPVIVDRNGQHVTIQWVLPGRNSGELLEQLISEWPMAYFFWLAGALTILFLRPKDERWLLLAAFNFVTAIWLAAGGGASNYHLWYSAIVLRMAIWLSVPIYLHLHWIFPRPLGRLHPLVIPGMYALAIVLMIAQWFQLFSANLYFLGFLIAILGSVVLLVIHAIRQPDTRQELRLLLLAILFILAPVITLALIQAYLGTSSRVGSLALLFFPLLPITYLFAAYRRQLGGLEIRINRLIAAYFFIILLGVVGLPLLSVLYHQFLTSEHFFVGGFLTTLLATMVSMWGFPRFQHFVERRWLGITLPGKNLPETYSSRIITSATLSGLLKLLEEEVFPSLLVKQYAFVRVTNSSTQVMLSKNVTHDQLHTEALTELLASFRTHSLLPVWEEGQPLEWVRLILPLQVESELLGAWLLGRRDPDDVYPQAELSILQSLANQTAVALSNVLQTERLRKMYEDDIDRNEKSRLQLALDLHDSVLNQLAVLRLNVDEEHVTPKFEKAYDEVTTRLREIVTSLRPPMLDYGLQFAFEDLADNLMERNKNAVRVTVNVQIKGEPYYPEHIERNVYRITQEACENSIRHGHAKNIKILAKLGPGSLWLLIEDDGVGFEMTNCSDLDVLLSQKHFGLAGMMERAMFMGAVMKIDSYPKGGTRIQVSWSEAHDGQADSASDNSELQ